MEEKPLNMIAPQVQTLPDCGKCCGVIADMQQRSSQPEPVIRIKIIERQGLPAERQANFVPLTLLDIEQAQSAQGDAVLRKDLQGTLTGFNGFFRLTVLQV